MTRLSFLADEHVKRSYVTALRGNGFEVRSATTVGAGKTDREHLQTSRTENLTILTNDDDFVRLAQTQSHNGIVYYGRQDHKPGEFVTAIRRIDRYFSPENMHDHIEWLENWL